LKKILIVFGTRPEAIKLAPVVRELKSSDMFSVTVCLTSQHKEMLQQVVDLFGIEVDYDLNLMEPNQSLSKLTERILGSFAPVLEAETPDLVLVHGDTTTCFAAALSAFYQSIPIGHVEAGLRTNDLNRPFPEEANRVLVGRLAKYHFASTSMAEQNLLNERVDRSNILVTGNTVIDSIQIASKLIDGISHDSYWNEEIGKDALTSLKSNSQDQFKILVTFHRRENIKDLEVLCRVLKKLASENCKIFFPVHLNPRVKDTVEMLLSSVPNVYLLRPLSYLPFVRMMRDCDVILSDSGGIQEEAPGLGTPVLILRNQTERPEAIESGVALLVGLDEELILKTVRLLRDDRTMLAKMSTASNPFGDGNASIRIRKFLERSL
jgi:UDP-N-acetylglucosamine 2-epimerase (non-hydrolysing)